MLVDKYEYKSSVGCSFTGKNRRGFGKGIPVPLQIRLLQIPRGLPLYRTPGL